MKKIIIFTFVLLTALTSARAQLLEFTSKEQFKAYCGFLKDSVGINMKMPKGFYVVTSLNNEIWFNSDNNGDFRNVMSGLALTENQDRLIVYPFLRGYVSMCLEPNKQLSLLSAVNLFARDAVAPPKTTILTDGKLCGGADSVVIAEFRHKVKNRYMQDTEVDVLINKKNYIPAFFRILFNEKGLKEKDSTIRAILKSVRYTSYDGFLEKAKKHRSEWYWPIYDYLRDHKLSKYFATSLYDDEYFKYLDSKRKDNEIIPKAPLRDRKQKVE